MKVKKVVHGLFLHGLGLLLDNRVLLSHAAKEKVQTSQERKDWENKSLVCSRALHMESSDTMLCDMHVHGKRK